MKAQDLKGAYVTIITPFDKHGEIDEQCLRKHVDFMISKEIRGICTTGVCGETAALTDDEKIKVLEIVKTQVSGRVQVLPDVGTECYKRTLELSKRCEQIGVDAIILFTPYLDIPTTEGLFKYYSDLADILSTPLVMHNVPARTNVDMPTHLIARLADHPNIIGIKNGNTSMEHISEIVYLTKGKDFSILTGKDTLAYPLFRMGGHGHISVAANLIPDIIVKIYQLSFAGEFEAASELNGECYNLLQWLYVETNPIGLKAAMNTVLYPIGQPRIPLTPMSQENYKKLLVELKKLGFPILAEQYKNL